MDELRLLSARIPGNPLVAAECASLTGAQPDAEGVAVCRSLDLLPQSAYLTTGLRCLAEAPTLEELVSQVAGMSFPADRFRLDLLRVSPASPFREPPVVLALANAIQAAPDLKTPLHRFLVVAGVRGLWFGEILNECLHSYKRHDRKPCRTSSSLPSRLTRALVNLVYPGSRSLLDPFCGTGSLLLEAQMLGLAAYGMDYNLNMVEMTRRNLEHFGYTAQLEHANALDCVWTADAIVTDLPYGRYLKEIAQPVLLSALCRLVPLAPQAVYVAGIDISPELLRAGYRQVQVYDVRKRRGMSRFVHCAQRE
jgi:hypothetical protein